MTFRDSPPLGNWILGLLSVYAVAAFTFTPHPVCEVSGAMPTSG